MIAAELMKGMVDRDNAIAERVKQANPLELYDALNALVSQGMQELEDQHYEYCPFCNGAIIEWVAEEDHMEFGHKGSCDLMKALHLRDNFMGRMRSHEADEAQTWQT